MCMDPRLKTVKSQVDAASSTDECQVTPVIHVLQYPGCVPKPIPSFACIGRCASYLQVSGSKIWQMERSCMCCQESGEREASVSLFCPKAKPGERKFIKDHKVLSGKSYKDAATSHLKVAIIDKDNPYGKITTEKAILVKKTLMGELDKTILSASCSKTKPPIFRSWTHSGEIIRVTCDDDLTLEWLKTKVPTLKTSERATLAVVKMAELPKLTKASFWVPGEAQADLDEKEVVLRRLEGQNPNLQVAKW
ncbi:unnamed protein product [Psylliodes chrysocephalus]|uniref:DUF4780 domain-containing protein n=1 Tax=Psylliodes chrysocephalus TaxID=3402493 RepID=A0A9P0CVU4_9CUCU|nr:unnamed protein product [Psylliodes chrysocephala]